MLDKSDIQRVLFEVRQGLQRCHKQHTLVLRHRWNWIKCCRKAMYFFVYSGRRLSQVTEWENQCQFLLWKNESCTIDKIQICLKTKWNELNFYISCILICVHGENVFLMNQETNKFSSCNWFSTHQTDGSHLSQAPQSRVFAISRLIDFR